MSTGRSILNVVAAATMVGGFAADWNRTHLFNPNWPAHARFHDAMTIAVSALLGAGGLYALNRKGLDPERDTAVGAVLPAVTVMVTVAGVELSAPSFATYVKLSVPVNPAFGV